MQQSLVRYLTIFFSLMLIISGFAAYTASAKGGGNVDYIVVGKVNGVIDGAVADYVEQLLDYSNSLGAKLVILELNTPGGSLDATLRITSLLRKSSVPVAGFVVERWAMSAGTIILMCTHYAAMEPGTVIGAVQPVALSPSGSYTPINESKILNPVYKEIEVCMKMHGRNASVAREFVYNNLVLDAEEARKLHVVEAVASDIFDLLGKINGSTLFVNGVNTTIYVDPMRVKIVEFDMPMGLQVAHWLSDPFIGSLLTSIGFLLLILSFATQHLAFASVAIALIILGLFSYGFSTSILAVALLFTGIIMLFIELFAIPGFGVVGFTGIALLLLGAIMMFTSKPVYIAGDVMKAAFYTLMAVVIPLAGLLGIIVYKALRAWRLQPVYTPSVVGKKGRAIDDIPVGGKGFVIVEGEYWQAINKGEEDIHRDDPIIVIDKEGSILIVRKASGDKGG
ncbi:nodulation protein NfeD [Pyrofollis japonicus]|uniref:NfeD family protein n=1 Tax=Pyrofollis japonicus TaxID=3060460 RepID=UPI00295AB4FC|nr:nodulation protein NfeD [Pyrofollis japonicus]BEP18230.1 nodulation protein NfeD [Pyrofollis japonicus]